MKILNIFILLFLLFFSCALINDPLNAQSANHTEILFLHFNIKGEHIELVESTVVPGKVKNHKVDIDNELFTYEVFSSSGQSLWMGAFTDPLIERVEYEDPEKPGRIKMEYAVLETAYFVIRVPNTPDSRRISFYKRSDDKMDKKSRTVSRVKIADIELKP